MIYILDNIHLLARLSMFSKDGIINNLGYLIFILMGNYNITIISVLICKVLLLLNLLEIMGLLVSFS